jgi:hypothetical protein
MLVRVHPITPVIHAVLLCFKECNVDQVLRWDIVGNAMEKLPFEECDIENGENCEKYCLHKH